MNARTQQTNRDYALLYRPGTRTLAPDRLAVLTVDLPSPLYGTTPAGTAVEVVGGALRLFGGRRMLRCVEHNGVPVSCRR